MKKRKGNSLIEVVVSLTLFAMVISFTGLGFAQAGKILISEEKISKDRNDINNNLETYLNDSDSEASRRLIEEEKIIIYQQSEFIKIDEIKIEVEKIEFVSGEISSFYYKVKQ